MTGIDGEIIESGRNSIRIHGGRQEKYNMDTEQWESVSNPTLSKTNGCLRAYDTDMEAFKAMTDNLQASDSQESPGIVRVEDDLAKVVKPASQNNAVEVRTHYSIPSDITDDRYRYEMQWGW